MPDHVHLIKNARISYPHLFKPRVYEGEEGKCGAVLLVEPDHAIVDALRASIRAVLADKNRGAPLPSDRLCLRDGGDRRPEYEGYLALSAGVREGERPLVVGANRQVIRDEAECTIYPGCRVHAKIRIWWQNNRFGKRVNAELIAVQFAGDDTPLSDTYISEDDALDGFGSVETDDALAF